MTAHLIIGASLRLGGALARMRLFLMRGVQRMAREPIKTPGDLSAILVLASILAINAPSAAFAFDFTFEENMIFWAPLNDLKRKHVDGVDDTKPPYCQINIDPRVTYMEAWCYLSNFEPVTWRNKPSDDFFYLMDGRKSERCYFRFYKNNKYMIITGCKFGGVWGHDIFWDEK